MVRVTRACGFDNDVGVAAQVLFYQARLYCADGHRGRYRQTILADIAVRQHQQNGAAAYHLLGGIAQRFDRLFQRGLRRIEGDIEPVGAIVLFFHRRELLEIRVQQNR